MESQREQFVARLRKEAEVGPPLPTVELSFSDVSYKVLLKKTEAKHDISTVPGAYKKLLMRPLQIPGKIAARVQGRQLAEVTEIKALDGVSGTLRPGTMTLLLAPPGGGKTSFLKALGGLLPEKKVSGTVRYSGMTSAEAAAAGVQVKQLVAYVDQQDTHLPFCTVRETLQFAFDNSTVDPGLYDNPEMRELAQTKVDSVIRLLGLQSCADTIIGNEVVRGVSGGEKKRVTIGEALVTNARVLLLDEPSTGLDSSVAFDILSSVATWARATGGVVLTCLLQPTPEIYHLFDDVILMREGRILYHGAREALPAYLASLGFHPPAESAAAANAAADAAEEGAATTTAAQSAPASPAAVSVVEPHKGHSHPRSKGTDLADWLVDMVTNPAKGLAAKDGSASSAPAAATPLTPATVDTDALVAAWEASPGAAAARATSTPPPSLSLSSRYAQAQYSRPYPRPLHTHLASLLRRQAWLVLRNKLFIGFRLMSATYVGFLIGITFFQQGPADGLSRFGLMLFSALYTAFCNFSEVPQAVEHKFTVYKALAKGMYPSWAYVLSVATVHAPLAATECLVYSLLVYWMTGLAAEPGRFFFYWLILFLSDVSMAGIFRAFAWGSPNLETAQVAPSPVLSIQMIFSGFVITRSKMGWLIFANYLSTYGWVLRSLAHNEFAAPAYDTITTGGVRLGEFWLSRFDIQLDPFWKWAGVIFVGGFTFVTFTISATVLSKVRIVRNIGTSRTQAPGGEAAVAVAPPKAITSEPVVLPAACSASHEGEAPMAVVVPPPAVASAGSADDDEEPPAAASSVLPFTPVHITFSDIQYAVTLDKAAGGGTKKLLRGVSGYARPGTLTALMGASGAGKTTLLEAIAGRKTGGELSGSVTLNGFPKDQKTFARLTALVEQMDVHAPLATVREALNFSAALRLPASVPAATRRAFVDEVLDLLELRELEGRLIGEPSSADGLSPGQRKRVTIAVELCSNSPVIFLDEPTSGLDARAAAVVMRVVRKIADSGRTVICTVHQPSAELFYMFDNLLLLQRGGWQVYFGPLGPRGRDLRHYLEALPGAHPCPPGMNAASWMLDVLAGTDSSSSSGQRRGSGTSATTTASTNAALPGDDAQARFFASPAWAAEATTLASLATPAPGAAPYRFTSRYARGWAFQTLQLLRRTWTTYNRNVAFNFTRSFALLALMTLFGIVWYDVGKGGGADFQGVQSLASLAFTATFFVGILNLNTSVGVLMRHRPVFYRERASFMYGSGPHAATALLVELPWLAAIVGASMAIVYHMAGFNPASSAFFFFAFLVWLFSVCLVSLAQAVAAAFSSMAVAQAVVGGLIPSLFLFGGLFITKPAMPRWVSWILAINPTSYAWFAELAGQFYCAGAGCPRVSPPTPTGPGAPIPTFAFVQTYFGFDYEQRWRNVGILFAFIAGFQAVHLACVRYINHAKR